MSEPNDPGTGVATTEAAAGAAWERLDRSWRALLAAIGAVPPERLADPGACGDWSVADLMGHVAVWDRYAVERGRDSLTGRPFRPTPWQEINDREAAARADRSPNEQRAEMIAAHDELLAFVAQAPRDPAALVPMLARMAVDTDHHYDEHAAEIRAFVDHPGA